MRKRNNIILVLAAVAVTLFCVVVLILIPRQQQEKQNYLLAQQDPVTHDLSSILPYQSKYMGNASNDSNLFHQLPLNEYLNGFELKPDLLLLIVNYKTNSTDIDSVKLQKTLIYNSVASFALIDNLKTLNYHFEDRTIQIERNDVQSVFSNDLSELLNEEKWEGSVQKPLKKSGDVSSLFEKIAK